MLRPAHFLLFGTALAALSACARARPQIPAASFLLVAGDSTFWIQSAPNGVRIRRSPMLLTEVDGRFYELYVADDDRSFYDALIVGQRIFRRDLLTGDSTVLMQDTTLAAIARSYAAANPNETPLAPDEDGAEEPATEATTETELLDVVGPYLTFEQHVDIDVLGVRDQHTTRRGVVDVRDGGQLGVDDLVGAATARLVFATARQHFEAAIDSVRRATGDRARRAMAAIAGFAFDSLSFALMEHEGEPAVAFLVPGSGPHAGGYALPLPPVTITAGPWWAAVRATLPALPPDRLEWPGDTYDVVVRDDSSRDGAIVSLRTSRAEWQVARVPLPARRLRRLDAEPNDSSVLGALSRAFDESSLYSGETRTAHHRPRHARPLPSVKSVMARFSTSAVAPRVAPP